MNARILMTGLAFAGALAASASAQSPLSEDELKAKELIAKIKKDMTEIDQLLLSVDEKSPAETRERMAAVAKNLDELLKQVKDQQGQVVKNIEELAALTKYSKGGSGECDNPSDDPKGGKQPKNGERSADPEVDKLKPQGEQEGGQQPQPQQPQQGEQQPEEGGPDRSKPEQRDGSAKPPDGAKSEFERQDTAGRWGVLPPKVAEILGDLSDDQLPPKYRKLIEQYYRLQNEKKP